MARQQPHGSLEAPPTYHHDRDHELITIMTITHPHPDLPHSHLYCAAGSETHLLRVDFYAQRFSVLESVVRNSFCIVTNLGQTRVQGPTAAQVAHVHRCCVGVWVCVCLFICVCVSVCVCTQACQGALPGGPSEGSAKALEGTYTQQANRFVRNGNCGNSGDAVKRGKNSRRHTRETSFQFHLVQLGGGLEGPLDFVEEARSVYLPLHLLWRRALRVARVIGLPCRVSFVCVLCSVVINYRHCHYRRKKKTNHSNRQVHMQSVQPTAITITLTRPVASLTIGTRGGVGLAHRGAELVCQLSVCCSMVLLITSQPHHTIKLNQYQHQHEVIVCCEGPLPSCSALLLRRRMCQE